MAKFLRLRHCIGTIEPILAGFEFVNADYIMAASNVRLKLAKSEKIPPGEQPIRFTLVGDHEICGTMLIKDIKANFPGWVPLKPI